MIVRYYSNGTEYEITRKEDGSYEISVYGKIVDTARSMSEAYLKCDKIGPFENPMDRLF